ncbi:cation-transporting P-type ATPase, partial [Limnospira sp. Paracas R14]|nr:cation-transporting P-type ATPase [Limnospira sp. Paracas R14]
MASASVSSDSSDNSAVFWHTLPLEQVTDQLGIATEKGLSDAEIDSRMAKFGPNELKAKKGKSPLLLFLIQFKNPLLYILLIAGAVKAALDSWAEAIVIWAAAVLNAVIAFTQEAKAESAISSLASAVTT